MQARKLLRTVGSQVRLLAARQTLMLEGMEEVRPSRRREKWSRKLRAKLGKEADENSRKGRVCRLADAHNVRDKH